MNSPWLTVIVTSYNGATFLPYTLRSIVEQADSGVKVIAVDDGSTDDTIKIFKSFQNQLSLSILESGNHTQNNWVANTNRGIETAQTPYVCVLHDDDMWLPGRLAQIRQSIDRCPQAVMHIHPAWFIDEKGRKLGIWRCPFPTNKPLLPHETVERLLVQNTLAMGVPVFRRDAVQQVGYLDTDMICPADWDFWLKLARIGQTSCSTQPTFAYRIHSGAITAYNPQRLQRVSEELHRTVDRHITTPALPNIEILQETCRFSIQVNMALYAVAARQHVRWHTLLRQFLILGPSGWVRFFRDSNIVRRVFVRLRLLLQIRRRSQNSSIPSEASS